MPKKILKTLLIICLNIIFPIIIINLFQDNYGIKPLLIGIILFSLSFYFVHKYDKKKPPSLIFIIETLGFYNFPIAMFQFLFKVSSYYLPTNICYQILFSIVFAFILCMTFGIKEYLWSFGWTTNNEKE